MPCLTDTGDKGLLSLLCFWQPLTCNSMCAYNIKQGRTMGMVSEFKEFAMKGSMIDMAVGIIIGAATGKVVSALVDSVIMPVVGVLMGGVDFSNLSIKVGEAAIGYGAFIQAIIDFIIIAFVIFMLLKFINNMKKNSEEEESKPSEDTELLREIRDLLRR